MASPLEAALNRKDSGLTSPNSSLRRTGTRSLKGPAAESTKLWRYLQEDDLERVREVVKAKEEDINMKDTTFGWSPVLFAANSGRVPMVKTLIDARAKTEVTCNEKNTPLMLAARKGHVQATQFLMSKRANLDAQNNNGWSALMWTAIGGYEGLADTLLAASASYHKTDNDGRTACMWAARHGHLGIVETLLACGLNLSQQDDAGLTVLDHAQEHMEMRNTIAAVEEVNGYVLNAAKRNDMDGLRAAIEAGADLNLRDDEGWTPLMWAALHDSLDMVQLIVRHGANPSLLDEAGNSLEGLGSQHSAVGDALVSIFGCNDRMLEAAKEGNWEAVDDELKIGAWINVRDEMKRTALIWASKSAATCAVSSLITKDASVEERDSFGWTAVHHAVASRDVATVSMLHYRGAEFTPKTFDGDSPLHIAVRADDGVMVQVLLAARADIEEVDAMQNTPLQIAAINGLCVALRTLLAFAADVKATDHNTRNSFALAVVHGHRDVLNVLLETVAPPPKLPVEGSTDKKTGTKGTAKKPEPSDKRPLKKPTSPTPKTAAAARGPLAAAPKRGTLDPAAKKAASGVASRKKLVHTEQVIRGEDPLELLHLAAERRSAISKKLPSGVGTNLLGVGDVNGCIPLTLAVQFSQQMIFSKLLELKSNHEATDVENNTVLMHSVRSKQTEPVRQLLDVSVRLEPVNNEGLSALDMCDDPSIRKMLDRHVVQAKLPTSTEENTDDSNNTAEGKAGDAQESSNAPAKARKVYRARVEKLPTQLTGDLLEEAISTLLRKKGAANPARLEVALDPITSRPRGYAYVDFHDAASAEIMASLDGELIKGEAIRVFKEAKR